MKDHDYRLKRKSFSHKVCVRCVLGIREDVNHVVMQCPCNEGIREEMFDVIKAIDVDKSTRLLSEQQNVFKILMGYHPVDMPFEFMINVWVISSKYIADMYRQVIRSRQ